MAGGATTERRPAWDEVQERQRRARAQLDAEHQAATAAHPHRPADTWRVCGHAITAGESRGCTCTRNDPSRLLATEAVNRLARERQEPDR